MILSPAHLAARAAAARIAAAHASLALLSGGAARVEVLDAASAILALAVIPAAPGTVDDDLVRSLLAAPLEGVVVAAGTPASARIRAGNGGLWAEGLTVAGQAGAGELRLDTLDLVPGRLLRILTAEIQG